MMGNNVYKIGFIILLVLNICLSFILWQGPRVPFQQGGGNPDLKYKISEDLGLSEVQEEKYFASAFSHQEKMALVEKKQRNLVKEYFDFLKLSKVDEDKKEVKLNEIAKTEAEKVQITFKHFEELKKLCNKDQLVTFEEIIKEIQQVLFQGRGKIQPPSRD